MADPLAQRHHRRSPDRTGVALVISLEIGFMVCCEGGEHFAAIFRFVKSYLSFFSNDFAHGPGMPALEHRLRAASACRFRGTEGPADVMCGAVDRAFG